MRSVAQRLTKTGDNHRMQSSTRYSLSLPPSLDLFLCLVLFADWISAPFSLTLDLLSLQSPPTHSPTSKPILAVQSHFLSYRFLECETHFLYFRKKLVLSSSFFGSLGGVEWCDRFTHLCHSDEHRGPCLPASPPGDGAAKRLWVFLLLYPPSICSQLPREDSSDAGL